MLGDSSGDTQMNKILASGISGPNEGGTVTGVRNYQSACESSARDRH